MRVGQVGCHIYLMGLYLLQQLLNDTHIALRHRQFFNLSTLIERQVEKVDMVFLNTIISTGIARLSPTDKSLDSQHVAIVKIALLLPLDESQHIIGIVFDKFVATIGKHLIKRTKEMHIESHLLVGHSDIS